MSQDHSVCALSRNLSSASFHGFEWLGSTGGLNWKKRISALGSCIESPFHCFLCCSSQGCCEHGVSWAARLIGHTWLVQGGPACQSAGEANRMWADYKGTEVVASFGQLDLTRAKSVVGCGKKPYWPPLILIDHGICRVWLFWVRAWASLEGEVLAWNWVWECGCEDQSQKLTSTSYLGGPAHSPLSVVRTISSSL